MKLGKVTGVIKTRAIEQQRKKARNSVKTGAEVYCAVFSSSAVYRPGLNQHISKKEYLKKTIEAAVGKAVEAGMIPDMLQLSIFLPEEEKEDTLRQLVREADAYCAEHEWGFGETEATVLSSLQELLIQVTLSGKREKAVSIDRETLVGQDVIVVGEVAKEGTWLLANEKKELLLTRYPIKMIEAAQELGTDLQRIPEAVSQIREELTLLKNAGEGGIFKAFWELAELAGTGLEIQLKKIPIRQETVEVCNLLDGNPYELLSGGTMVAVCRDGQAVADKLAAEGIGAAVVGRLTDNNDRVIVNDDERRFLEPAKSDELYRIYG